MNKYIKHFSAFAVSASLVALGACGGGGGGGGQDTPASKAWGPAESLQVSGTLQATADVALNAAGQGYAAWVERAGDGTSQLMSQRYSDGQWQARMQVANATVAEAFGSIKLAVLPDGQSIAVWVKETGTSVNVEAARTQNHAWLPFAAPIQEDAVNVRTIQLASDDLGNAMLVWEGRAEGDSSNRIYATTVSKDGFKPVETISTGAVSLGASNLTLDVAANGDAIAAWTQGFPETVRVHSHSAGQWAGTAPVELSLGRSFSPHAAIGPNGTAAIVWAERVDANNRVAFSTTENLAAGLWKPMAILENSAFSASSPQVVRDPQGGTTIVWTSRVSGSDLRTDAWGQRLGTGAAPGQKIETRDEGTAGSNVLLAGDTAGSAVAVWAQDVNPDALVDSRQIFSNQFNPATAQWSQAEQLDPGATAGPGRIDVLKLAMDATGRAMVLRVHSTDAGVNTLVINALR